MIVDDALIVLELLFRFFITFYITYVIYVRIYSMLYMFAFKAYGKWGMFAKLCPRQNYASRMI